MEAEATTSPEATTEVQHTDTEAMAGVQETPEVEQATTVDESTGEATAETIYADKYKSVGELENGYKELQSTFSKKMGAFPGAPEAYEIAEGYVTDDNQGLADMLTGWGKENQLSNDGLNALISNYNEYHTTQKEAAITEEFKKLGDDANIRIDNARSFLEANLGAEATQALAANMNTAASIQAIEALIAKTKTPKVAPVQSQTFADEAKIKEMRFAVDEHGVRKMENPQYRAMVLKMEATIKK